MPPAKTLVGGTSDTATRSSARTRYVMCGRIRAAAPQGHASVLVLPAAPAHQRAAFPGDEMKTSAALLGSLTIPGRPDPVPHPRPPAPHSPATPCTTPPTPPPPT